MDKPNLDHAKTLFETIDDSLNYIYEMAHNEEDLAMASDVKDRYGEQLEINSGASKIIYSVFDYKTEREVAMACPKSHSELQIRNFSREALLTASMEHPNIIPVHDLGQNESGLPYFTMKLMKGKNLSHALKKDYSLFKRLEIFNDVCEGLAYAHSKGIIHLDIKPANIQIGEFGEVLICDWGLAKILFSEIEGENIVSQHLFNDGTLHGYIKGTPGFMAPEQAMPDDNIRDQRTDIYALGGLLYFLLTGKAPIDGKDINEILLKTQKGELNSFSSGVSISPALQAVIHKALAPNQYDRYQSIKQMQNEIDSFTKGFATVAENASFLRLCVLFINRHKTSSLFLGVLILLSIIFVYRLNESEKNAHRLLNLYSAEKELTKEMSEDVLPKYVSESRSALQSFDFKEYEAIIIRAEKYAPMAEKVMNMKAAFLFYSQRFREADELYGKLKEPNDDRLALLSKKYAKLKPDTKRLSHENFNKLLADSKSYGYMRPLLGNERKNYSNLKDYVNSVKIMFELTNPKLKNLNFKFCKEGELNCLDLSNCAVKRPHFSALKNLPIHKLSVRGMTISDYNANNIATMPLKELDFTVENTVNIKVFLKIKTLKKLILNRGDYKDRDINILRRKMEVILMSK